MVTAVGNGQSGATVTVVVADDHPLMRADLVRALRHHAELQVVGTASDGEEAVALVTRLHPDVILLDIRMPHMDGLQAARAIRASGHTAVVLISAYDEALYAAAAADVGAAACLSKLASEEELVATVLAAGRHLE